MDKLAGARAFRLAKLLGARGVEAKSLSKTIAKAMGKGDAAALEPILKRQFSNPNLRTVVDELSNAKGDPLSDLYRKLPGYEGALKAYHRFTPNEAPRDYYRWNYGELVKYLKNKHDVHLPNYNLKKLLADAKEYKQWHLKAKQQFPELKEQLKPRTWLQKLKYRLQGKKAPYRKLLEQRRWLHYLSNLELERVEKLQNLIKDLATTRALSHTLDKFDDIATSGRHRLLTMSAEVSPFIEEYGLFSKFKPPKEVFKGENAGAYSLGIGSQMLIYPYPMLKANAGAPIWVSPHSTVAKGYAAAPLPNNAFRLNKHTQLEPGKYIYNISEPRLQAQYSPLSPYSKHIGQDTRLRAADDPVKNTINDSARYGHNKEWSNNSFYERVVTRPPTDNIQELFDKVYKRLPSGRAYQRIR